MVTEVNMLQNEYPLWLPEGSVRSILALVVVSAYIAGYIDLSLATLVLGFYFGQKVSE